MRKPWDMPLVVPDAKADDTWEEVIYYSADEEATSAAWFEPGKVVWQSEKREPMININVMPGCTRETAYQAARSAARLLSTHVALDTMSEADQRALWHELNLKFAVR